MEAIVVNANWNHNPWFNEALESERQTDLRLYPDRYPHIWEVEYAKAFEGAYYAEAIIQAGQQKRIGRVTADPVVQIRAYYDIGGAGAKADAMAIWIGQFVDREIRLLDYIEGIGQPLGYYANELRTRGWKLATVYLPHDGVAANSASGKRYIDHWSEAGFDAAIIKNTGTGAAMMGVEAGRRVFPKCYFNADTTEAGTHRTPRRDSAQPSRASAHQ
jgi:phage terminase large subunit